jgi:hypothetical protein
VGEGRGGAGGEGEGVDAEEVGSADDAAKVALVGDAVGVEDEGVAPGFGGVGVVGIGAVDGVVFGALVRKDNFEVGFIPRGKAQASDGGLGEGRGLEDNALWISVNMFIKGLYCKRVEDERSQSV